MLKVIIVDDEYPACVKLEKQLKESGLAEVADKFTEPLKALDYLKQTKVDAVFLDIEMPDMDGIELSSRILDIDENIAFVFVTAYNQYAVEAFRLNAIDYLLKPVYPDRLTETLRRIINQKRIDINPGKLKVQCFGKFSVSDGSHRIRFRTEKAEELMAFLIDSKCDFISRSIIIDNLWEDFDGDRAIIHFNTTLYYVKKALLPYKARISILYDRGSYKLDANAIDCDYLKFCSLEKRKEAISRENIFTYEEAASLYSGEYLSGCDYDWAAGKRLWLLEQYIGLILSIAEYYMNSENYIKAVNWLKEGLHHEPLHRELNYRLIKSLLLSHERALAVRHYELYKSDLAKKLGEKPDKAFERLLRGGI
jgi:two-component system LytT family response regulator